MPSTQDNEKVALLALTKLPMSIPQAGPSKPKSHPPHQPRTLPSQQPASVTGLNAKQRAQITQAVRSGPINEELLRAFLWRYYQASPAYKRGQAVSYRQVKSSGAWQDASSKQLPLVRIDGTHSGQSEGVLHGKTMAFWRYNISFKSGEELVQTRAWDIELGHPQELSSAVGPGILPETVTEMFKLEILRAKNPILHVLSQAAILQPLAPAQSTSSKPQDDTRSSFLASKKPIVPTQRYLLSDKLYMAPRADQPAAPKGFVFPTEPRVFRSPTESRAPLPSTSQDVQQRKRSTSARPLLLMPEIRSASLPPPSEQPKEEFAARPSHKRSLSEIDPPDMTKTASKSRRLSLSMLCAAASDSTYSPFEFE